MIFKNIAVVGAGQMGHGIALVSAVAGAKVWLLDNSETSLNDGIARIERTLKRMAERDEIKPEAVKNAIERITPTLNYADFKDCDLGIESASENEQVKYSIIKELCKHLPAEAYVASNTSSISITRMGAKTDRAEKFCGVHFMKPVHATSLVELIRGLQTSDQTYKCFEQFATDLKKTTIQAEDFPGFIVNRILIPMINEAVYTLYEGVGSVKNIDEGMKLGSKHPLGPLELADFIGLDTVLAILQVLHADLADSKYRPCPLLVKYVESGWLGRKTNRGFYDYEGPEPVPTR